MSNVFIDDNGNLSDDGQTYVIDHYVQTFMVRVRSLDGIDAKTLQNQIEKRWETLEVRQTDVKTHGVRGIEDFAAWEKG